MFILTVYTPESIDKFFKIVYDLLSCNANDPTKIVFFQS